MTFDVKALVKKIEIAVEEYASTNDVTIIEALVYYFLVEAEKTGEISNKKVHDIMKLINLMPEPRNKIDGGNS